MVDSFILENMVVPKSNWLKDNQVEERFIYTVGWHLQGGINQAQRPKPGRLLSFYPLTTSMWSEG